MEMQLSGYGAVCCLLIVQVILKASYEIAIQIVHQVRNISIQDRSAGLLLVSKQESILDRLTPSYMEAAER